MPALIDQQQTVSSVLQINNSAVYGVVLNDADSVTAIEEQLDLPPYKAPPKASVLYIKPKNTFVANQAQVVLPKGENKVEIAATIALIIGKRATKVTITDALSYVESAVLVADLSLPHDSYYRPAIREKCFDGALPIADSAFSIDNIEQISIQTKINDQLVATSNFKQLIRKADQLLSDVSAYMTLRPADALLLNVKYQAPQATLGDQVTLSIEGLSELSFTINAGETL